MSTSMPMSISTQIELSRTLWVGTILYCGYYTILWVLYYTVGTILYCGYYTILYIFLSLYASRR